MSKVQFHPSLAKLSVEDFKKLVKVSAPDETENWETHFKRIGGKVPTPPREDKSGK